MLNISKNTYIFPISKGHLIYVLIQVIVVYHGECIVETLL